MSSDEPEYDKWLKYSIELHKTRCESLDDGYEPVEPDEDGLPEIQEDWNTEDALEEIDAMNLRLKRDLVYSFRNQIEIKRRALFPTGNFQCARAMSRWGEKFLEEIVDEHVNRKSEDD